MSEKGSHPRRESHFHGNRKTLVEGNQKAEGMERAVACMDEEIPPASSIILQTLLIEGSGKQVFDIYSFCRQTKLLSQSFSRQQTTAH